MVRVVLPAPLRALAGVDGEVELALEPPCTTAALLDALADRLPPLRNAVLDPASGKRRPFLRFYVDGVDCSHEPLEAPLPEAVTTGAEPFIILGAIAGG